jgi:hypothetical protein
MWSGHDEEHSSAIERVLTSPDDRLASVERADVGDEVLVPCLAEVDVLFRTIRRRQRESRSERRSRGQRSTGESTHAEVDARVGYVRAEKEAVRELEADDA